MKNITSRSVFFWSLAILAVHSIVYFFMLGLNNPKEALITLDDPGSFRDLPFQYSKWIHVLVIPFCLNALVYLSKRIHSSEFIHFYLVGAIFFCVGLISGGYFIPTLSMFLIILFTSSLFMTTPFISLVGILITLVFMVCCKPQIAIFVLTLFGSNYVIRTTIFGAKFWDKIFETGVAGYKWFALKDVEVKN